MKHIHSLALEALGVLLAQAGRVPLVNADGNDQASTGELDRLQFNGEVRGCAQASEDQESRGDVAHGGSGERCVHHGLGFVEADAGEVLDSSGHRRGNRCNCANALGFDGTATRPGVDVEGIDRDSLAALLESDLPHTLAGAVAETDLDNAVAKACDVQTVPSGGNACKSLREFAGLATNGAGVHSSRLGIWCAVVHQRFERDLALGEVTNRQHEFRWYAVIRHLRNSPSGNIELFGKRFGSAALCIEPCLEIHGASLEHPKPVSQAFSKPSMFMLSSTWTH